jgi:hypothetical protein
LFSFRSRRSAAGFATVAFSCPGRGYALRRFPLALALAHVGVVDDTR